MRKQKQNNMPHNTQHEDHLQSFIQSIESNVDDAVENFNGAVDFDSDIASLNVMSNLAIAQAINNLSRSIRDSFGSSTNGAAFLEKIAMVLDSK